MFGFAWPLMIPEDNFKLVLYPHQQYGTIVQYKVCTQRAIVKQTVRELTSFTFYDTLAYRA